MTLNYKSFGKGPALIILHGLFGSLDNWITQARDLRDTYSVFILDQRNHGKSPHDEVWDYPSMAEDLHEFMEREGIFLSHILGHSMGGKTAIQFASMYPEKVDNLIIADMGMKKNPPVHTEILEAMNEVDLTQIKSRGDADEILSEKIPEISIRQFLLKSLGRDQSGNFSWKFNLKTISENYENVLASVTPEFPIDKPTLFITGGKSDYVNNNDISDIKEKFPQATFKEISDAGHWLHAEAPEEFIRILREYLT